MPQEERKEEVTEPPQKPSLDEAWGFLIGFMRVCTFLVGLRVYIHPVYIYIYT